jgi:hypothetical protein
MASSQKLSEVCFCCEGHESQASESAVEVERDVSSEFCEDASDHTEADEAEAEVASEE